MRLSQLYIHKDVADMAVVHSIQERLGLAGILVADARYVFDRVLSADDPIGKGKDILFLTRNKGAFIKDCPGTRHYTCCGYRILHIGTYCSMDCSYCILQSYFHPPVLQFYVNFNVLFEELDRIFASKSVCRLGTGEFTDSMIWEPVTDLNAQLIDKFSAQNCSVLELKTKTVNVEGLKNLRHNRKTIIAWSLNTEKIIRCQERRTASLSARLSAAAKCQSWGYPLAFHFDPIVIYDGCAVDYCRVIENLFSHVLPENIVWISLGTFRFMPALKPIIQQRFPDSKIVFGEFIPGIDDKMRYFKPLRIDIYKKIISCIRQIAPEVIIYFCMEDDEVWEKCIGFIPSEYGGLPNMLDRSAALHCYLEVKYD